MTGPPGTAAYVGAMTVGILGGTGQQGRGLATRLAAAGQRVLLGSRDPDRARAAAARVGAAAGLDNTACARAADLVVVAVPYEGHRPLLEPLAGALAGKVVVDCVSPLAFDARGPYVLPVAEGSAAAQAQALLPDSTVVGAFHHVSAVLLLDPTLPRVECDVLVVGDDRAATGLVVDLAARIPGMRGVYAGRIRNAGQVEALTANLFALNRRYRTHAGLRVTGLDAGTALA